MAGQARKKQLNARPNDGFNVRTNGDFNMRPVATHPMATSLLLKGDFHFPRPRCLYDRRNSPFPPDG